MGMIHLIRLKTKIMREIKKGRTGSENENKLIMNSKKIITMVNKNRWAFMAIILFSFFFSCQKEMDVLPQAPGNTASESSGFAESSDFNSCATDGSSAEQLSSDPETSSSKEAIEQDVQNYISGSGSSDATGIVTIPVVVHVVYNTAAQNISDAQIQSQIAVLNEDYGRTNADRINTPLAFQSLAANTNIRFVLAKRDPSGKATNGITRTPTSKTYFTQNNYVKFGAYGGKNAWPRDQYLNIWVCNLSYAGYATYPGASASIDGVVIKYQCFGRTGTLLSASKKGRTTTHEVGHWLNLEHTWGLSVCGDDHVSDTPTQQKANSGFPVFPHRSTCSTNASGDMFMDYMDYTDDAARNMFTQGQSSRMNATLRGYRASLLTSLGGIAP